MSLRVLAADRNRTEWLAAWERTRSREPFGHPDYCALFTAPGVAPRCAVRDPDPGREGRPALPGALFPFLLRELSTEPWTAEGETRRDVAVPAGYGGAFLFGEAPFTDPASAPGYAAEFWDGFAAWSRGSGVVCADARISLCEEEILPWAGWTRTRSSDNVVVDLVRYREHGHQGFSRSLRRNIRLAARNGVRVEPDDSPEAFEAFLQLYHETMDRRGAIDYYRFTPHFFEGLRELVVKGLARLFLGRGPDGTPLCGEVVLLGGVRAYAFLAGGGATAHRLHANELVRSTICSWLAEGHWNEFVLGGGNEPDDDLFQYKLRFAPEGRRPYHVGAVIHAPDSYAELVRTRAAYQRSQGLPPHRARRFPAYR
ncbi:hypothetical protein C0Q58_28200 [Streptomyces albidoflavus]|uniref:GNAT family N-acetyltransferase n=1 Tax=Streptomyces albidoflavus TaxID=1886 RepID=UPI00101E7E5D|nr:GNAT family N-acetyltransferase [Streptomyces albidoflavus]RZD56244.1 hypothetical protein C0Q58_28200 [Streptomyces albidoflavus]